VLCVKHFESWHGKEHHPYVGYGHQLKKGEKFTAEMTERQADSLLRADLWERLEVFMGYGKDALLLTLLSYNVGVGRLLGYGKQGKSQLLRKIEQKARFCEGYSDGGRRNLLCFISIDNCLLLYS
jgi:lysozyme-related protein